MHHRERSNPYAREALTSSTISMTGAALSIPKPRSKTFSAILYQLARFAGDDSITILFEGESGTGKNWLAREAHRLSRRAQNDLHETSLATVVDSLAASELFGHAQGAFTDARGSRAGAFQSARRGTLFLDEVGKASPAVQRLLLRAVEDRVVIPVGSDRAVPVDVRLLLATNVSLESLVGDGRFLPDLFARLGQFRIVVPPLRERREDIPDLARYFLAKHAARSGYSVGLPEIHPALMGALQHAPWKYNLRELDGTMHRLILEADSAAVLTFEHCVDGIKYLREYEQGRPTKLSPGSVAAAVTLADSVAGAARALDISRSTIYRKLAQIEEPSPPPTVAD
ncbi:MAG: sigma 54-interacting transcriptional regulator [Gemmatimonadota bacterium]|nr:sigma 54-interacting transcriptional regulator [Gemmatimonadota bacterium]